MCYNGNIITSNSVLVGREPRYRECVVLIVELPIFKKLLLLLLTPPSYQNTATNNMMKLATYAALVGSAAAFAPAQTGRSVTSVSETKADLEALAAKANPAVKFFDPLNLAEASFWGTSNEATIGFLRESEVKHGRVAMAAFVGYIVHANGITWPWPMTLSGEPFPQVSNAPEAWDAIPEAAKWQIMLFVGFLEAVRLLRTHLSVYEDF